MRLAVRRETFTHPDWIFEIKYDGFRSLARVDAGQAELISRRRNVYKSFTDLCADLKRTLQGHTALLDGEIVCLDPERKAAPNSTISYGAAGDAFFYAFDLPYLDGRDRKTTWIKVLNPDYSQRAGP
jgi:bifunctional non-homologous end joining protein LigD